VLFPALLKDDLVGGGAIVIVVKIEPVSAAPGKIVLQFPGIMNQAAELRPVRFRCSAPPIRGDLLAALVANPTPGGPYWSCEEGKLT
jgi:hypothetical protein